MQTGIDEARDRASKAERIRLLEAQAESLRREIHFLHRWREQRTYTASWHVFRALFAIEFWLNKKIRAWTGASGGPAPLVERRDAAAALPDPSQVAEAQSAATPIAISEAQPARLLIDVTATVKMDPHTGIQRVVKSLVTELYKSQAQHPSLRPLAVRLDGGRLVSCENFVASLLGGPGAAADAPVQIEAGDRLFMLADSWREFDSFPPIFSEVRSKGGAVFTCVYDLIPVLLPAVTWGDTPEVHERWLRTSAALCDGMIAISRTVADEIAAFIQDRGIPHHARLKVGWFHCGSDLPPRRTAVVRDAVKTAFGPAQRTFLAVGTIEPRKGYDVILAAFDRLWSSGFDARLVIFGRRGWYVEGIVAAIMTHPEFGRRLFWFENGSDAELDYAYGHTDAVVCASYAEGFGLPIAEAARRERPAIASDIPVFREVGGDGVAYFRVDDADALAQTIRRWSAGEIRTDPTKVSRASWADAATRIVEIITKDDWYRVLD
ncbi:MAG: glycosyltransferase family 4 protein [Methylobacteriaceae bacterium]|nr:glycosyltransferase family 4 protein [Methylobacteriaceae bacterium]